jgi:hypothetical protein
MGVPVHQERAAPPAEPATERRDSARVPLKLLVRDAALGGSFEPFDGNLGIGGVYFEALHPPVASAVELRFLVPGAREEVHVLGDVLRVTREGHRFGAHVKFVEIPIEAELAIARYLQQG